jgi:hypothetical protein
VPGTCVATLAFLSAVALAAPTEVRGQVSEAADPATSQWQYGVRGVEWEEVVELQDEVRGYHAAGAIGAYELRITTRGTRFDAFVTAEIADATRLAELRGIETTRAAPEGAVSGKLPSEHPS